MQRRTGVKTLIAFVAACGSVFYLLRTAREDPETRRLATALRHDSPDGRAIAALHLSELGSSAVEISAPLLLEALGDPDERVRGAAVRAFGLLLSQASPGSPPLPPAWRDRIVGAVAEALHDPDREVRDLAVAVLRSLTPVAPGSVPRLIDNARDRNPVVVLAAAAYLGRTGGRSDRARDALVDLVTHQDPRVRTAALDSLKTVPMSTGSVRAAISSLDDPDAAVSTGAAELLKRGGPGAELAAPRLLAVVRRRGRAMPAAVDALVKVAPESPETRAAIATLVQIVDQGDPHDVDQATRALARAGPSARAAAPALLEAVRRLDENLLSYCTALGSVGRASPEVREAVSVLAAVVRAKDDTVIVLPEANREPQSTEVQMRYAPLTRRRWALQALACLAADANTAATTLREAMQDDDPLVRAEAEAALWRIQPPSGGAPRLAP
jgi:hypothetical protein